MHWAWFHLKEHHGTRAHYGGSKRLSWLKDTTEGHPSQLRIRPCVIYSQVTSASSSP